MGQPAKIEDPNKPLTEAIAAIPRQSRDVGLVVVLVDVMIDRLRKDNDTSTHDETLTNQGGIKELKSIRNYLSSRNT